MIQIERIVKEVINNFIKENCYPVNEYYGRFNTKKEDSKLMPSNKYQVMVYSNDHNPPHCPAKRHPTPQYPLSHR